MTADAVIAWIYWASLGALAHTWGLYGLLLFVWVRLRPGKKGPHLAEKIPTVSFIIASHNEERWIGDRLKNLRALRFDGGRMEVLVASDGSTDGTCRIVREVQETWSSVHLLEFPRQRGRAVVHNEAVAHVRGDILVFTDAETRFDEHFLEHVLPHLQDPIVGAVSGRIRYVNEGDSSITISAGLYWRLEERLRTWESRLGLLAFGTGAAFCMRRTLYRPLANAHDDVDYSETLAVVGSGYRVHYEPRAVAFDTIASRAGTTHRIRVRRTSMAFRSILQGVIDFRLWRRPGILFSILSHKLLRHVSPVLLLCFMVSNVLLWSSGAWYRISLMSQGAFYALALLGALGHARGWTFKPLAIPFTFVLLNFSRMVGIVEGLLRKPPPTYR